MNDLERLEAAMERSHRHQLGWVFVREYIYHRKRGKNVTEAIAAVELMWRVPKAEVLQPKPKLPGWLGCIRQVA
jgi:hypothetical protein